MKTRLDLNKGFCCTRARRMMALAAAVALFIGVGASIGIGVASAGDGGYAVEFRGADIRDAIRLLAYMNKQNVVVPDVVQGTVTVSFDNISIDEAMTAILDVNQLGAIRRNNTLSIVTEARIAETGEDLRMTSHAVSYARAGDLVSQVQPLLTARGTVVVDSRTNTLTVRDRPENVRHIQRLIRSIDTPEQQVLLEAKVIQATKGFFQSLGVEWNVTKGWQIDGGSNLGATGGTKHTRAAGPGNTNPFSEFGFTWGRINTNLEVKLTAAEQKGDINIISRPSIVTMNNEPATIRSGVKFFVKTETDNIRIVSAEGGGTVSSNLREIDAGINLNVTPQISMDQHIKLVINVTQSEPDFANVVDGIPSIRDNSAQTTVFLRDGETTIIGGLLQSRESDTVKGIPVLSSVPILGLLFGGITKNDEQKELVILIRPQVVRETMTALPDWDEMPPSRIQ